jgi:hypothetical protein
MMCRGAFLLWPEQAVEDKTVKFVAFLPHMPDMCGTYATPGSLLENPGRLPVVG